MLSAAWESGGGAALLRRPDAADKLPQKDRRECGVRSLARGAYGLRGCRKSRQQRR